MQRSCPRKLRFCYLHTQDPEHKALIPLVESALAVMRLSCEKFFVLLSVLAAHLLFRDRPPRAVRLLIRVNARISTVFQKVCVWEEVTWGVRV